MIKLWPTNRTDEVETLTYEQALDRVTRYIDPMSDDEIAAYGGIEGRIYEALAGFIAPWHPEANGEPSCDLETFDRLAAEVRTYWRSRSRVTTVQHPTTGERYTVKLDADGRIIAAAGPLDYRDPIDDPALLDAYLANQSSDDLTDDAAWLRGEIDQS